MNKIMKEFPPKKQNQVTLENWRTHPYSSWSFSNVRELIPTSEIQNDPSKVWELGTGQNQNELVTEKELTDLSVDSVVVLHKGNIVFETYQNNMDQNGKHILFSVSKSILGLLCGILEKDNLLDTSALVSKYIPEIKGTAYKDASIRDCLDMQVGVYFDEDYLATSGPIISYRYAANWNPTPDSERHLGLRSFLQTLKERDGDHGHKFHYVSPNTDLLRWVIERVSDDQYSNVISEKLWKPLGAEQPGYITVDRFGAPRSAGGKCFTTRDLARVGMMIYQNGSGHSQQIVPESWIEDIFNNGNNSAWDLGDMAPDFPNKNVAYRSKWYSHKGSNPMIHGIGIHGQYLFVDRVREISISWFSSDNDPLSKVRLPKVLSVVNRIRDNLT